MENDNYFSLKDSCSNTTYMLKMDDMDFDQLPMSSGGKRDTAMPLWSARKRQEYVQFEVYSEILPSDVHDETKENTNLIKCHICNTNVPMCYISVHNESPIHTAYTEIANTAFDRVQRQMSISTNQTQGPSVNTHYCQYCCRSVAKSKIGTHNASIEHVTAVSNYDTVENFLNLYKNGSHINMEPLTCDDLVNATDLLSKEPIIEQVNDENVDANVVTAQIEQNTDHMLKEKEIVDSEELKIDYLDTADEKAKNLLQKSDQLANEGIEEVLVEEELNDTVATTDNIQDQKLSLSVLEVIQDAETKLNKEPPKKYKQEIIIDDDDDEEEEENPKIDTFVVTKAEGMKTYVNSLNTHGYKLRYVDDTYIDVIVYDKPVIRLKLDNYHGLIMNGEWNSAYCNLCQDTVLDANTHRYNTKHMDKLTLPILNEHCMREIESGISHCGICNELTDEPTYHAKTCEHMTLLAASLTKKEKKLHPDLYEVSDELFVCKFCHEFVAAQNVYDHVLDKQHNANAVRQPIDNKAAMINDYCTICEVYTNNTHKNSIEHKIGLLKAREANGEVFHGHWIPHCKPYKLTCVICDEAVFKATSDINNHIKTYKHKEKYDAFLSLHRFSKIDEYHTRCLICKKIRLVTEELAHSIAKSHKRKLKARNIMTDCEMDIATFRIASAKLHYCYENTDNPYVLKCKICKLDIDNTKQKVKSHRNGTAHNRNFDTILVNNKLIRHEHRHYCPCCDEVILNCRPVLYAHVTNNAHVVKLQSYTRPFDDAAMHMRAIQKIAAIPKKAKRVRSKGPKIECPVDKYSDESSNSSTSMDINPNSPEKMKMLSYMMPVKDCNTNVPFEEKLNASTKDKFKKAIEIVNDDKNEIPNTLTGITRRTTSGKPSESLDDVNVSNLMIAHDIINVDAEIAEPVEVQEDIEQNLSVDKDSSEVQDNLKDIDFVTGPKPKRRRLHSETEKVTNSLIHINDLSSCSSSEDLISCDSQNKMEVLSFTTAFEELFEHDSPVVPQELNDTTKEIKHSQIDSDDRVEPSTNLLDVTGVNLNNKYEIGNGDAEDVFGKPPFDENEINTNEVQESTNNASNNDHVKEQAKSYRYLFKKIGLNIIECKICQCNVPNIDTMIIEHVEGLKHENLFVSLLLFNKIRLCEHNIYCDVCCQVFDKIELFEHLELGIHQENLTEDVKGLDANSDERDTFEKLDRVTQVLMCLDHRQHLMSPSGTKLKCDLCNTDVENTEEDVKAHIFNKTHLEKINNLLIKNEIRESDNKMHCGACRVDVLKMSVLRHIYSDHHKGHILASANSKQHLLEPQCIGKDTNSESKKDNTKSNAVIKDATDVDEVIQNAETKLNKEPPKSDKQEIIIIDDDEEEEKSKIDTFVVTKAEGMKTYINSLNTYGYYLSYVDDTYIDVHVYNKPVIRLKLDNYHGLIMNVEWNGAYCNLCQDTVLDVDTHRYNTKHMAILTLPIFNEHCMREIESGISHCGICNELTEEPLYHAKTSEHMTLLATSLSKKEEKVHPDLYEVNSELFVCKYCHEYVAAQNALDHVIDKHHITNSVRRPINNKKAVINDYCTICKVNTNNKHKHSIKHEIALLKAREANGELFYGHWKPYCKPYKLTCMICDEAVFKVTSDLNNHIKSNKHKEKYDAFLSLHSFSKIDDYRTQCLICKKIQLVSEELGHSITRSHKRNLKARNITSDDELDIASTSIASAKLHFCYENTDNPDEVKCIICNLNIVNSKENVKSHRNETAHNRNFETILSNNKLIKYKHRYYCPCCDEVVLNCKAVLFAHVTNNSHIVKLQSYTCPFDDAAMRMKAIERISTVPKKSRHFEELHALTKYKNEIVTDEKNRIPNTSTGITRRTTNDKSSESVDNVNVSYLMIEHDTIIVDDEITEPVQVLKQEDIEQNLSFNEEDNSEVKYDLTEIDFVTGPKPQGLHSEMEKVTNSLININDPSSSLSSENLISCDFLNKMEVLSLTTAFEELFEHDRPVVPQELNDTTKELNKLSQIDSDDKVETSTNLLDVTSVNLNSKDKIANGDAEEVFSKSPVDEKEINTNAVQQSSNNAINADVKEQAKSYSYLFQTMEPNILKCKICQCNVLNIDTIIIEHVEGLKHENQFVTLLLFNKMRLYEHNIYCDVCCQVFDKIELFKHLKLEIHLENLTEDVKGLDANSGERDTFEKLDRVTQVFMCLDHRQHLMSPFGTELNCKLCNTDVENTEEAVKAHIFNRTHFEKFNNLLIENEIREADNKIHCGVCRVDVLKMSVLRHVYSDHHKGHILASANFKQNTLKPKCSETTISVAKKDNIKSNAVKKDKTQIVEVKCEKTETAIPVSTSYECTVCNVKVPNYKDNIKGHNDGARHKKNLADRQSVPSTPATNHQTQGASTSKQNTKKTTDSVISVLIKKDNSETNASKGKELLLNDKVKSYKGIPVIPVSTSYVCTLCDVKVPNNKDNIKAHNNGARHKTNLVAKRSSTPSTSAASNYPQGAITSKQGAQKNTDSVKKDNSKTNCVINRKNTSANPVCNAYVCTVCNVKLSYNKDNIKGHIDGAQHKQNLAERQSPTPSTSTASNHSQIASNSKQSAKKNTDSVISVSIKKINSETNSVIKSKEQSSKDKVKSDKTTAANPVSNAYTCTVCNVKLSYNKDHIQAHNNGARHKSNLANTKSLPSTSAASQSQAASTETNVIKGKELSSKEEVNPDKIPGSKAYVCTVCNVELTNNKDIIKGHNDGAGHKKNLAERQSLPSTSAVNSQAQGATTSKQGTQKQNFSVAIKKDKSVKMYNCTVCKTSLPFDSVIILSHHLSAEHCKNAQTYLKSLEDNVKPLNDNTIKIKANENVVRQGYCYVCEKKVPNGQDSISTHIDGKAHKNNLKLLMETILITNTNSKARYVCTICNVDVNVDPLQIKGHIASESHKANVKVVTNVSAKAVSSKNEVTITSTDVKGKPAPEIVEKDVEITIRETISKNDANIVHKGVVEMAKSVEQPTNDVTFESDGEKEFRISKANEKAEITNEEMKELNLKKDIEKINETACDPTTPRAELKENDNTSRKDETDPVEANSTQLEISQDNANGNAYIKEVSAIDKKIHLEDYTTENNIPANDCIVSEMDNTPQNDVNLPVLANIQIDDVDSDLNDVQMDAQSASNEENNATTSDDNVRTIDNFYICKLCDNMLIENNPVEVRAHLESFRHNSNMKDRKGTEQETLCGETYVCNICDMEIPRVSLSVKTHNESSSHRYVLRKKLLINNIDIKNNVCYCKACDLYFTVHSVGMHIMRDSHKELIAGQLTA